MPDERQQQGRAALNARPGLVRAYLKLGSDIKPELNYVAVSHNVVFAFHAHLAVGAGLSYRAVLHQVVKRDNLSLNEATLKVGVDHAGSLWGGPALVDSPGARLLGASGQVGLQAQGLKAHASQLV